ncbi:MAG: hypothetical protein JNK82_15905 [Myxococcaceae bacterium]|nr:hypothetical protein [Myxococcaceae bacterium]
MRASLCAGALVFVACSGGVSPGGDAGIDAGPQPKLSALPDCGTAPSDAGTANDLYTNIVVPYGCASGGCHGGTPPNHFEILDGPTFRTVMLEESDQVPGLPRVTPGNLHRSYVMYKLLDQHKDAGYSGSGERMPFGGPYLSDSEVCSVANWITAGAP